MSAKILPITNELKKYGLNPNEWNPCNNNEEMGKVLFFNKKQKDYYFEGLINKNQIMELALKIS